MYVEQTTGSFPTSTSSPESTETFYHTISAICQVSEVVKTCYVNSVFNVLHREPSVPNRFPDVKYFQELILYLIRNRAGRLSGIEYETGQGMIYGKSYIQSNAQYS